MTNEELARGLWRKAESRYRTVHEAIRQEDFAYAIRSAQECVELCLKALLISAGVDPPKWHDVGPSSSIIPSDFLPWTGHSWRRWPLFPGIFGATGKEVCTGMKCWDFPRTVSIPNSTAKQPRVGRKKFSESAPGSFGIIENRGFLPPCLLSPLVTLPWSWLSFHAEFGKKGKIAFENGPGFQTQTLELDLKYCLVSGNLESRIQEEVLIWPRSKVQA